MSLKYVIGLDGGGTSTKATALDIDGKELLRLEGGSINVNGASEEDVISHLTTLLKNFEEVLKARPEAITIGAAGLSNPRERAVLEESLAKIDYQGKVLITGDQHVALYGAHGEDKGIFLISGTGSICLGIDDTGKEFRSGGRGYLIDDVGSAYDIGRNIIIGVVQAHDGRAEKTVFTELVQGHLGIKHIDELVEFVYTPNRPKKDIADLAVLVTEASARGDELAQKIQEDASFELFKMVKAVAEQMQLDVINISFGGSVLSKNEIIRDLLTQHLNNLDFNLNIVEAKHDPAYGAAQMALELLK